MTFLYRLREGTGGNLSIKYYSSKTETISLFLLIIAPYTPIYYLTHPGYDHCILKITAVKNIRPCLNNQSQMEDWGQ